MPSERLIGPAELEAHLQGLQPARRVEEVIVHHTWAPTAAQYQGLPTIQGVRRYHMNVRGWSDNGYHVMIGPNGDIWLCRPLEREGAHCLGHNARSVGVAYVANFDTEDPRRYGGLVTGQRVVAALLRRFGLGVEQVHFLRQFADKSCPGTKLDLATYRKEVGQVGKTDEVRVVLEPDGRELACRARVEESVTRVDLRPLAEALGYAVEDRIRTEGRVVVRGEGKS